MDCECVFKKKITLDNNGAYVENTLINNRSDKTDYGEYN